MPSDRRLIFEKLEPFFDRHVQHLGDVLALEGNVERVAVVTLAFTDLTRDIDVGQEVHFDLDRAVARTGLAAPTLHVERETSWQIPANLGLVGSSEQFPDVIEHAGVGSWIRTRGPADRRLVDCDDFVDVLNAFDLFVKARWHLRAIDALHQARQQDLVDQRLLTRTRDAGDPDKDPERNLDVYALQIVLSRTTNPDRFIF